MKQKTKGLLGMILSFILLLIYDRPSGDGLSADGRSQTNADFKRDHRSCQRYPGLWGSGAVRCVHRWHHGCSNRIGLLPCVCFYTSLGTDPFFAQTQESKTVIR